MTGAAEAAGPVASDRPAPITRRRAQTRTRLMEAAFAVFAERGFGRATVEDVCERAGFSRGAFYSNFASLDELFFALYADYSAALVRAVRDAVAATVEDPHVDAVVDRVLGALPASRERWLINTEFMAHALRNPDVGRALAEHRRALRAALIPVLRVALGASRAGATAAELDGVARAVIAVQEGMTTQELLEPDDARLPALHRRAMSAVVDAAHDRG